MTTKDFTKAFKQLDAKPAKKEKYIKHNSSKKRTTGIGLRKCRRCGRWGGHVRSYGIHLCRMCFREDAKSIGFKKFS
ncbi:MAG TPA: 30S ribosomal protein S14 [Candidatus Nanoarchaeia archaeon]|nr:30S ribosomal protein S14 [Candidatus Nanoarchaeia archaeon]